MHAHADPVGLTRLTDGQAPDGRATGAAWWREWEVAALVILVALTYFTRLSALPVCGEESRWATAAREMLATGDFVVPRQQGAVFPERPPLGSWAMAAIGVIRGEVDLLAIRLPSALAVLVLSLVIYYYARQCLSSLGSLAAALVYATFGQVLPLGQLGESESVFTMFIGSGLLLWHGAYLRGRSPLAAWCLGYSLVALGALVKGPQAPAYFVAATGAYLLWRRDWRWLFGRGHIAGMAVFGLIVGAWMIPFAAMHWESLDDIWAGLASDRFTRQGLGKHLLSYPLETFGCLLPWSPLYFTLLAPSMRRWLTGRGQATTFLLIALAVTYPSVWFAAGARGRYYMPMYPCLAVLLGMIIEGCAVPIASLAMRQFWQRYLRVIAVVVAVACGTISAASLGYSPRLAHLAQPLGFLWLWIPVALATSAVLMRVSWKIGQVRPQWALVAMAGFLAVAQSGVVVNCRLQAANDLDPALDELKARLGAAEIVSLGRIDHRFAYFYETPIRRLDWPRTADEVEQDLVYFCFDRRPSDTEAVRSTSDGRLSTTTSGTLPFEWDEVAQIGCDPLKREVHSRTVVVGRVRRAKFDPAVRTASYQSGQLESDPPRTGSAATNPTVLR